MILIMTLVLIKLYPAYKSILLSRLWVICEDLTTMRPGRSVRFNEPTIEDTLEPK